MEPEEARKRTEAFRYRLQVRATQVSRAAREREDRSVTIALEALQSDIRAVEVGENEWVNPDALVALQKLEPRLAQLEAAIDVQPYGAQRLPKWVRYLLATSPVLVFVLVIGVVIARRRKKAELDAASLARLEEKANAGGQGT